MRTPPPPASAGAGVLRPRIPAEKDVGLRFPPRTAARKSASRAPAGGGGGTAAGRRRVRRRPDGSVRLHRRRFAVEVEVRSVEVGSVGSVLRALGSADGGVALAEELGAVLRDVLAPGGGVGGVGAQPRDELVPPPRRRSDRVLVFRHHAQTLRRAVLVPPRRALAAPRLPERALERVASAARLLDAPPRLRRVHLRRGDSRAKRPQLRRVILLRRLPLLPPARRHRVAVAGRAERRRLRLRERRLEPVGDAPLRPLRLRVALSAERRRLRLRERRLRRARLVLGRRRGRGRVGRGALGEIAETLGLGEIVPELEGEALHLRERDASVARLRLEAGTFRLSCGAFRLSSRGAFRLSSRGAFRLSGGALRVGIGRGGLRRARVDERGLHREDRLAQGVVLVAGLREREAQPRELGVARVVRRNGILAVAKRVQRRGAAAVRALDRRRRLRRARRVGRVRAGRALAGFGAGGRHRGGASRGAVVVRHRASCRFGDASRGGSRDETPHAGESAPSVAAKARRESTRATRGRSPRSRRRPPDSDEAERRGGAHECSARPSFQNARGVSRVRPVIRDAPSDVGRGRTPAPVQVHARRNVRCILI